jgi:hypothetical protein
MLVRMDNVFRLEASSPRYAFKISSQIVSHPQRIPLMNTSSIVPPPPLHHFSKSFSLEIFSVHIVPNITNLQGVRLQLARWNSQPIRKNQIPVVYDLDVA